MQVHRSPDRRASEVTAAIIDRNAQRGAEVFFALVDTDTGQLAGSCTLNAGTVLLTDLLVDVANRLPRFPQVSVILLGRLAIAHDRQDHGLGEVLLINGIRRAIQQSAQFGPMAVLVDAKDDRARSFCELVGFCRLKAQAYRLVLPKRTIEQLG